MGRESTDWALDHASALAKSLAELEMWVWYATDVLLEADAIFRAYGPPPAPGDEVAGLLASVRDYLLTVPHVDTDLHNHPMPQPPPPLPETSAEVGGVPGKDAAPSVGPGLDIGDGSDFLRPATDKDAA